MRCLVLLLFDITIVAGYQCILRDDLDGTIDTCKSIMPYSSLAQLSDSETTSVDVTISNMENEIVWGHFLINDQNVLRCMALHPPCDSNLTGTMPVCIEDCVDFADNFNTFDRTVEAFCKKYFNPTETLECAKFAGSSMLSVNMYLVILLLIAFSFCL